MQGPFASLKAMCAAYPCGKVELEPGEWVQTTRDCGSLGDRALDSGPFAEAGLWTCDCRSGLRDDSQSAHLVVRRADGWWRSAPLGRAGGNDKYCSGEIAARWETRQVIEGDAPELVLRLRTQTECLACSKQGSNRTTEEHLVVAAAGPTPITFAPVRIAQCERQRPFDDVGPGTQCPTFDRRQRRELSWVPGGVVLTRPDEQIRFVSGRAR